MKSPNRMKCTNPGCGEWLNARLVSSHRLSVTTYLFRKTAALITCPRCDESKDPDTFSMWEELRGTEPPRGGVNPHGPTAT